MHIYLCVGILEQYSEIKITLSSFPGTITVFFISKNEKTWEAKYNDLWATYWGALLKTLSVSAVLIRLVLTRVEGEATLPLLLCSAVLYQASGECS